MTIHIDDTASHAVYSPSSAHRWTVCTASAEAISRLPQQEEGEAAAKGTAAHSELERVLGGGEPDGDHPSAYGVALAVSFVKQLSPGKLWIEQRVALTPQIWGRTDVAHYDAAAQVLTILDLKDGFVDVDVVENEQERIYAAATIFTHNLPVKWIRYVIVQPNSIIPGPRVKQWSESVDTLYAWATEVAKIPDGIKRFVAGENCKYCPLFGRCPASQDVLTKLGVMLANPADAVPMEQRAIFKACAKPIADWFAAADKAWMKDALSGQVAPGMKLVTTTTRRAWKDEAAARKAVLERFGPDALDPPTPAQAEKLGLDISDLASAPDGGPALAFESDRRKPWTAKSAAEMFAGVTGGKP
jgi:hypothetical protein